MAAELLKLARTQNNIDINMHTFHPSKQGVGSMSYLDHGPSMSNFHNYNDFGCDVSHTACYCNLQKLQYIIFSEKCEQ